MTSASSVAPAVVPERPARGGPPGTAPPGDDFAAILQTTARTAPAEGQTSGEPLENGSAEPETALVVPALPAVPQPSEQAVTPGHADAVPAEVESVEIAAVPVPPATPPVVAMPAPPATPTPVQVSEGEQQAALAAQQALQTHASVGSTSPSPSLATATEAAPQQPDVAAETATPATPATPTSNGQPATPAQPAAPATAAAPAHHQHAHAPVLLADRLERVHALVQLARSGGTATARLELHPLALGRVDVLLRSSAEGVIATVAAMEPATAEVLQQAGDDLRRSLEDRGVTVARIDLQLGAQGDERGEAHGAHPGADGRRSSRSVAAVDGDEPTTSDPTTTTTTTAGIPAGALVDVHA